jgi:hypothetical protein
LSPPRPETQTGPPMGEPDTLGNPAPSVKHLATQNRACRCPHTHPC